MGSQVDIFYLPYFSGYDFHFAGHFVTISGYNEKGVWVVDMDKTEEFQVPWDLFSKAGHPPEKVPMKGKRFMFYFTDIDNCFPFEKVIPKAVKNTANTMLNPPIKNLGIKGISKFAEEVKNWHNTQKEVK